MAVTQEIGIPIDLSKGNFIDTEIRDGKLQLKLLATDDSGNGIYPDTGYWESEVIAIKDKIKAFKRISKNIEVKGTGTYKIYTRSSPNQSFWTPYVEINSDSTINSPPDSFAQVKIELFATRTDATRTIDDFNKNGKYDNKYVNSSGGFLELKKDYGLTGVRNESWVGEGVLFSTLIEKSKFKKINKLGIREE